ncbi:cyclic nucleotide-binding domain-containing protein [Rhodocytophaga aerolata]|uniref:cyclic nucleotide-binding domain-containing protein n=1 Tax=Rhodocytophaga aerolata TaxID=455078 RepID=UPI00345874BA
MLKTILLIESGQGHLPNTSEVLELASYQVLQAGNGVLGVELAIQSSPDLILCDILVPELDGFGVLHILKKNPLTERIPFIFMSEKDKKGDFRKGMSAGADDYLIKPFDDTNFLQAVEMQLKKIELQQAEAAKNLHPATDFPQETKGLGELQVLLADKYRTIDYAKKQVLFWEGELPTCLYYIISGKIKVFKTDPAGNEYITHICSQGDYIGYSNLLEGTTYSTSAEAMEDSLVCTIRKEDFLFLLYHNHDVANQFIKMLSTDVVHQETRMMNLAYHSVRKRVAEALLLFQSKYHPEGIQSREMVISREDLSNLVGASKETVIRVLSDFKEEGLIKTTKNSITVLNFTKLLHLKN